jgi:hypothetical protein
MNKKIFLVQAHVKTRGTFCLAPLLCLLLAWPVFAQKQKPGYQLDRKRQPVALTGEEEPGVLPRLVRPHSGFSSGAVGPGFFLMESYYDYGSNGGVLTNLERNDDGTMMIGRMAAQFPGTPDRGTYYSYFDGSAWSSMSKVEALRRGWSNIAALADNRNVVAAHSASADIIGNEVNVDVYPGIGIWVSSATGWSTTLRAIWPRLTVDAANTIIVCMTTDGNITGVQSSKEIALSRDEGATWTNQILLPDTTLRVPQFSADDQAMASFGNQTAIAVAELGGDIHLWESFDNGANWTYRNVTNYPRDIPVGTTATRPYRACDLIYDNEGRLHLFWEALLATQDSAGTELDLFESRNVGIQHWSEATGIQQAVSWADLPEAALESDEDLFRGGGTFDQVNAVSTLTMQPQAGVDQDGALYLLFAALRPLDYDPVDSTHYTDVYAVGSGDGGATWGEPVNLTDTPQSEDLWASLADEVDDSLRFVYQSDGETGNSIQGGGAAPTNLLYHAFPKNRIPLKTVGQIALFTADTLSAFPSELIEVPVRLTLVGNRIAALGAALKATNRNLIYESFAPGPILPANATFTVQAVAADSVRLAFVDFGSGPIAEDGVLATLRFRVDKNAPAGSVSELVFRELSASNDQLQPVRVRGGLGKVTIFVREAGIAIDEDLFGGPGDTLEVPVHLAVAGNEIAALGAAIKLSGNLLSFVRFTPGEIIPGATFLAHAPTPDSVRLAYVDFGGGPLVRDGVLAKLYFAISPNALVGDSVTLNFSGVSAARSNFENVPLQSSAGKVTVQITAGKISGVLFEDVNGNGVREANEPGLAQRTVRLNGVATTTDSLGHFNLSRVAPGRYKLAQDLPSRWVQSLPAPAAYEFDLVAGAALAFEFGSWQYATVRGEAWHDRNANQRRDGNEPGLGKWKINLSGVLPSGQSVAQTLTTSRVGEYQALQLAPGQYRLRQQLPRRWVQTYPSAKAYELTLTSGAARGALDFGAFELSIDGEDSTLNKNLAEGFSVVPETFVLAQNYPNPFSANGTFGLPATRIVFGVPRAAHVKLEVFDVMGQRVAVLSEGNLAAGYHVARFDAGALAGGLYFAQLTAEGIVLRRKMTYLK